MYALRYRAIYQRPFNDDLLNRLITTCTRPRANVPERPSSTRLPREASFQPTFAHGLLPTAGLCPKPCSARGHVVSDTRAGRIARNIFTQRKSSDKEYRQDRCSRVKGPAALERRRRFLSWFARMDLESVHDKRPPLGARTDFQELDSGLLRTRADLWQAEMPECTDRPTLRPAMRLCRPLPRISVALDARLADDPRRRRPNARHRDPPGLRQS